MPVEEWTGEQLLAPPRQETTIRQQAFLEAFKHCGNITAAAEAAGIKPRRHYVWLEKYPDYESQFDEATAQAAVILKKRATLQADAAAAKPRAPKAPSTDKYKDRYKDRRYGPDKQRHEARERDGNKCVICGFSAALYVRRIVPRAAGGGNDLNNSITLCPNDHALAELGVHTQEQLRALISRKSENR